MKKKLIAVVGPTASGKTALSFALAEQIELEIVCMDSMQIYKRMDIGTAKPTQEERKRLAHHMLDIVEPSENYSVAEYSKDSRLVIEDILSRGKLPLLVGGTGLYLNALSMPFGFAGQPADFKIRQKYEKFLLENGNSALFEILKEKDELSAKRLHPNDTRRVIRALEVFELTGKSISAQAERVEGEYRILPLAIDWDRQELYQRINKRVDEMLELGLLSELKALKNEGLTSDMQSMQGIGYKELLEHFEGKMSLDEALELIKQRTRNYAKRQLTWFRRDERLVWLRPDRAESRAKEIAKKFLEE